MIVGIDLGTSTSEVAVLKNGRPLLLREVAGSAQGILPSVVAVESDGQLRVGESAERLLIPKPDRAVQEVKRKMGSEERVTLGAEEFTPQEISARILRHLKQEAEKYLGQPVTEAVITVPAYFNDRQRRATQDAADIAGLRCRRLINEPTAAALAYGIERPGVEEKIVVYDLGGGTLDVTVLELSEGYLDVLASTGNAELGGKDFDERLMDFLRRECMRAAGVDLFATPRNRQKLKAAARHAKEELSSVESVQVMIENAGMTPDGDPVDFERALTRAEYEGLVGELVESTRSQLDQALAEKGLRPDEIDTVLMVGGSTRTPLVRRFVSEYFGGRTLRTEVSPDEAVALGAAVLSGIESRQIDPGEVVITDVSAFTFGVEVLSHEGGQIVGGVFSPIIRRNTTIPCTRTETYYTSADFQRQVHVKLFQGDAPLCRDNTPVGDFRHEISAPGPEGQPIEIRMSYNLNGIIEVVARDVRGKESGLRLQPDRAVMSDEEKVRARARMDAASLPGAAPAMAAAPPVEPASGAEWKDSPLYGKVAALLRHADGRLSQLSGGARARVDHLTSELKAALAAGDAERVAAREQELIDALFELD
ncbi:MAG TPA: Hsp70 family protein [Longimicrobium sp.]|nr:Hsp70 family protein [Longimicrobium sp.]